MDGPHRGSLRVFCPLATLMGMILAALFLSFKSRIQFLARLSRGSENRKPRNAALYDIPQSRNVMLYSRRTGSGHSMPQEWRNGTDKKDCDAAASKDTTLDRSWLGLIGRPAGSEWSSTAIGCESADDGLGLERSGQRPHLQKGGRWIWRGRTRQSMSISAISSR